MSAPRILCIDDYEPGLQTLKLMLEQLGYSVLATSDPCAALELFDKIPCDAVVLDFRMPLADGEAVARELKRRDPKVRIVMLSGYPAEVPERVAGLVDAFVAKGSGTVKELMETLASLTSGQAPSRSAQEITETLRGATAADLQLNERTAHKLSSDR